MCDAALDTTLICAPGFATPVPRVPLTWAMVVRRCRRLTLTEADLRQCRTMGDLQRLAKPRYRALLKRCHPDHAQRWGSRTQQESQRLRAIRRTYAWLLAWPEGMGLPSRLPPLPRTLAIVLPATMQPKAWTLPAGYHQLPHWTDGV
jgi:hypothetical protein